MSRCFSRCVLQVAVLTTGLWIQEDVLAHPAIEQQIQEINRALAAAPADAGLTLRRAELFFQHAQYKDALDDLAAVERISPGTPDLAYRRAKIYREMKRFDEARALLEHYVADQPANASAQRLLSRIYRDLGQFDQAVESGRKAIQSSIRPSPDDFLELAALQRSGAGNAAALQTIEQGISKLGSIVTLQLAALSIEEQTGLFDAALQRIDALKSAGVQEESRLVWRARVLAKSGRDQEARENCLQAKKALLAQAPQRRATAANQELLAEIDSLLGDAKQSAMRAGTQSDNQAVQRP